MNKKILLIIVVSISVLTLIGIGIIISDESVSLNGVNFNIPEEHVLSNSSNNYKLVMIQKYELLGVTGIIEIKIHDDIKNKELKGESFDINGTKVYTQNVYTLTDSLVYGLVILVFY